MKDIDQITLHFHKVDSGEWSGVAQWDPEVRYKPIGSVTPVDASLMIQRAQILLAAL